MHLKHRHYSNQAQGASVFAFKNFFSAKRNKAKQNLFGMCIAPKSKKIKIKMFNSFSLQMFCFKWKLTKRAYFWLCFSSISYFLLHIYLLTSQQKNNQVFCFLFSRFASKQKNCKVFSSYFRILLLSDVQAFLLPVFRFWFKTKNQNFLLPIFQFRFYAKNNRVFCFPFLFFCMFG